MRSEVDWCSAWEAAWARSPQGAFGISQERATEHWDRLSQHYESDTVGLIDERTWGILVHEGLVPAGGTVLDIGCGTGVLTERFARSGANVIGLDISPGMLSLARQRCSGLENAVFVCHDWNAFSAVHDYDLVFSSFCPGVDGLSSILRMESMSRGRCCLVSLGHEAMRNMAFDVWADLGAPNLSLDAFDPLYPYNVLMDMGRSPEIRDFRVSFELEAAKDDAVDDLVSYMSMFQQLTGRELETIERAVSSRTRDGTVSWREERQVRVLFWSVDPSVRNGPWL